jgi:hypothetical protein
MNIDHITWRKASYSAENGGNCVEVSSARPAAVAVRDSKDPNGPRLALRPRDWEQFITQVKAGAFDLG